MKRYTHSSDYAKEFKNGNISIKYDTETIESAKNDELLTISEVLNAIDCYFIGETFCLSNYASGHMVYNAYSDLVYTFNWKLLEDLKAGKTIKLYAKKPDGNEKEEIEKFMSE